MRNILLIAFVLLSINAFGQSKYNWKQGYRFIIKAEKNYQNNNLDKAERFLKKARLANYGFCGNAWASAMSQVNITQVQIHLKRNEYDKALAVLDSTDGCGFGGDCEARDSLKVITLNQKFGKEKVKDSFKKISKVNGLDPNYSNDDNYIYWVFLDDLNYKFLFYGGLRPGRFDIDGKKILPPKSDNEFYDRAKHLSFYKLIE